MNILIVFVLLFQVNALYDTCKDAQEITLKELDENGVATFDGITTNKNPFCWVCISEL